MSDIIERLRASEAANVLTNEAADEIFRLRETVLRLHQQRELLVHQVTQDGKTVALAGKIITEVKSMCSRS